MLYNVAEELFATKGVLKERARVALARTPNGQPTTEVDAEFLLDLFQHHDEWAEKSAGGVREITTQTTIHGTRCFVLREHDNSEIDVSFPHAIRLIPNTRTTDLLPQGLSDFRSAARSAIRVQMFAFRDEALHQPNQCPVTGEQVIRSNAAVDHPSPRTFDELVFSFCNENGINPLNVAVGSERGVVAVLEGEIQLNCGQLFHQARASLRLISRLANLQLPKPKVNWSRLWL